MRWTPGELLTKLQEMGVVIDMSDPLTKKVCEIRYGRRGSPNTDDPLTKHIRDIQEGRNKTVDYTPAIDGKGRPLKEIPVDYMKDVLNFVGYIESTKFKSFRMRMKNLLTGENFYYFKPYVHRWTELYRRGVLAKFYALEAYLGKNVSDVMIITLTTSSRNKRYEEVLSELKDNRKKLLDVLRWKYGTIDYFWFFEYHKSGFSHIHIAYFYSIPLSEQVWLKHLWSDKYGSGSFERGLNFRLPDASSDGSAPKGIIGSIRKYLTKYVSKGLHHGPGFESPQEVFICGKKIPLDMSYGELLFNALLKKTKTRLWGCSRHFSEIMKKPENEHSGEFECVEIDQFYGLDSGELEFYPDESEAEKEKHFYSVLWMKKQPAPIASQIVRRVHRLHWYVVQRQSWSIPGYSHRPGFFVYFDKVTQLFNLCMRGYDDSGFVHHVG